MPLFAVKEMSCHNNAGGVPWTWQLFCAGYTFCECLAAETWMCCCLETFRLSTVMNSVAKKSYACLFPEAHSRPVQSVQIVFNIKSLVRLSLKMEDDFWTAVGTAHAPPRRISMTHLSLILCCRAYRFDCGFLQLLNHCVSRLCV